MIDPLSDNNRKFSPYTYGNDNPVRLIDPDGMSIDDIISGQVYRAAEAQDIFGQLRDQ